eukprot:g3994.t1
MRGSRHALEALHKNRSQADEALIAATEHIATQLHRKIHGNDDNIIYLAEQRRGVEVIFGFSLDPSLPANFSIVCADV